MEHVFVAFQTTEHVTVVEGSLLERLPGGAARVRFPAADAGGAAGAAANAPAAGAAANPPAEAMELTVEAASCFAVLPSDRQLVRAESSLQPLPAGLVPAAEVSQVHLTVVAAEALALAEAQAAAAAAHAHVSFSHVRHEDEFSDVHKVSHPLWSGQLYGGAWL